MQRRPGWSGALTCTEIPANHLIRARRGEDTFLISLRAAGRRRLHDLPAPVPARDGGGARLLTFAADAPTCCRVSGQSLLMAAAPAFLLSGTPLSALIAAVFQTARVQPLNDSRSSQTPLTTRGGFFWEGGAASGNVAWL